MPICGLQPASQLASPVAPVTPVIDGRESTFYEWRGAGRLEGRQPAGAMSRGEADSGLQRVRFGFDEQHLYLAIELAALAGDADSWALELAFTADGRVATVTVPAPSRARPRAALPLGQGRQAMVAVEAMLELAVPLAALPCGPGAVAELAVTLRQGSEEVERWPERGAFEFPIPDDDLWLGQWIV